MQTSQLHQSENNASLYHTTHELAAGLADHRLQMPLLRRVSRSDTSLQTSDVFHDPTFRQTLSGIPELPASGLSINTASADAKNKLPTITMTTDGNKITSPPSTENSTTPNALTKAASFIHTSSFGLGNRTSSSSLLNNYSPQFFIGGNKLPPPPATTTTTITTDSVDTNHLSPVTVAQQQPLQQSASTMGLFTSATTDSTPSAEKPSELTASASAISFTSAATQRLKSGAIGVFNRGFFAKPVLCNEEENYRYILALDRS